MSGSSQPVEVPPRAPLSSAVPCSSLLADRCTICNISVPCMSGASARLPSRLLLCAELAFMVSTKTCSHSLAEARCYPAGTAGR